MTREEIIQGLQFTIDMFLFNPSTGEIRAEHTLNDMDKTTVDACREAIKALEQEPTTKSGSEDEYVSRSELMCVLSDYYDTTIEYRSMLKEIAALPSVTPQEPRWIPVSERLPESCGMYIVTRKIYDCPDTAPIIMSDESWFDGQNTWHNDNRINHDRGYLSDVIAWMPLPEPMEVGE